MAAYKFSMENLKGILIRQLTTGIYKEATKGYTRKLHERQNIRTALSRITGETFKETFEENMAMNLNFSALLSDLKNQ